MSWCYRVVGEWAPLPKSLGEGAGQWEYRIIEVYGEGTGYGWSTASASGDSPEEVAETLRNMLENCSLPPLYVIPGTEELTETMPHPPEHPEVKHGDSR